MRYLSTVNAFLEQLLLLVHLTGGQPARGTELLCIQHSNATDVSGGIRNIFIENGLVSFVTYYHKGYSITGTTKIIHRYLPSEVGELLIYYVWLVVPFLDQLSRLAKVPGFTRGNSPYVWGEFSMPPAISAWAARNKSSIAYLNAKPTATTRKEKKIRFRAQVKSESNVGSEVAVHSWPSIRLSAALSRTFRLHLRIDTSIQLWRHAAIAISRRHLQQAKFKRDFIEAVSWAWNDEMAAHSIRLAGLTYARGLQEAPGHVASAKTEYRRICREWHAWLGFGGHPE